MGEVGLTYPGLSGKTKEDFGHGDARFVTYMNVYSNAVANPDGVEAIEKDDRQHEVMNGDVFFTGSSETPDEVGLSSVWLGNSTDTYLNSFCFGYRPSKQLDPLFLASSLRSPQMRSRIILLAQGISRFNISKTQLMQQPLCFPSFPEQHRIGEFFSTLDSLIAAAERQEALLRRKKQAYLQLMFPQEGETEPRLRFAGFNGEWEQRQLGEVAEVSTGGRNTQDGIDNGKYPFFIRSQEISSIDQFDYDETAILVPGDGRIGEIFHLYSGKYALHQRVYRVVPNQSRIVPNYLLALMQFRFRRHVLRLNAQGTVPSLRLPFFTGWEMPLPSLPEQQGIGEFFSTLDSLIAAAERRTESFRALKSAYLQRMFV